MSMCKLSWGIGACFVLMCPAFAVANESPNLGKPISAADAAAWDISIAADGRGLPPGRGSAIEGARVYEQKCLACHGDHGMGQPQDRLVGGRDSLAGPHPVKTVGSYWPFATTLFDYV